jgi:hypothetical protein
LKRNNLLFHSYFTKILAFWFILLTAGNTTAQVVTTENISVDDSVASPKQKVDNQEIPAFYITEGTFIFNSEITNADIITIPQVVYKSVKKNKSELKKVGEKLILKKKQVYYKEPIVENKILLDSDHPNSDKFSNNTIFSRNVVLPQNSYSKQKYALVTSITCYLSHRISRSLIIPLWEMVFSNSPYSKNFCTRPPPGDFFSSAIYYLK